MAEEFYVASAGVCGGNWWGSPRNAMFPGISFPSPCFVDVSNFYLTTDSLKSRRIHDDYSGGDSQGFSAWDYQLQATSPGNGFSPSVLSDPNQTDFPPPLLSEGEKVAEINSYASILSEFSGEVSSTLVSDLYCSGGITAGIFNDQTLSVSAEDHFLNIDKLSSPSLPKFRSNWKPSCVNKPRPSNKTATTDSINAWASSVDSSAQQRPGSKLPRYVKASTKRSTNMVESMLKRPRIETPSPLPTFKVRKEKLGDRITALQQLVSPFGKTDTASVLHEAIDYIKFLHNQVHVLSEPRGFSDICGGFPRRELRSQGLCLVPISSTFPVASETPVDFWSPTTLGGTNFS